MDSGTVAFWVLMGAAAGAFLSVVLKLKWWTSTIGWWFCTVSGTVVALTAFIFTLQLDIWPDWIKDQARAIIYGILSIPFFLLIIDIWRKNRHHWAWSKDEHR